VAGCGVGDVFVDLDQVLPELALLLPGCLPCTSLVLGLLLASPWPCEVPIIASGDLVLGGVLVVMNLP
jgi:hypothetical protein